jgi:hypothetical protein
MADAIAHIGSAKLKGCERVLNGFLTRNRNRNRNRNRKKKTLWAWLATPPESDDSSDGVTSQKESLP